MNLTNEELFPATLKGLAVALAKLSQATSQAVHLIETGLTKNHKGEDGNAEIRHGLGAMAEASCTAAALSTLTLPWIGSPASLPGCRTPAGSPVPAGVKGGPPEDFELCRSPGRPVKGFKPVPPMPPPPTDGEVEVEETETGGEDLEDPLLESDHAEDVEAFLSEEGIEVDEDE
jgi:hypothetical protein